MIADTNTMKKYLTLVLLILLTAGVQAQLLNNAPKTLPAFDLTQADGSPIKASSLKPGKPVMLVYFDPDCDHCSIFTKALLKDIHLFSHVQIVMVTYVPVESLRKYIEQIGLQRYPQIKAGTEGTNFIVRYHYNVVQFPFIALHDRYGRLVITYESEVPTIDTLAAKLKNM